MGARCNFVRHAVAVCTIALTLTACEDQAMIDPVPTTAEPVATQIGVSRDLVTIREGETVRIRAADGAAASRDVSWNTSDESIAAVDVRGTVRGVSIGTTMITVVSRNGSSDVVVTVLPNDGEVVRDAKQTR